MLPTTVTQDALVTRAHEWFCREYSRHFPQGGDVHDHYEAQRAAMEAVVVALTDMKPCPYCDPRSPGLQTVGEGMVISCGCDLGFYEPEKGNS